MKPLPSRILVAGAGGLIGRALIGSLRRQNCEVRRLVRRKSATHDEFEWDPTAQRIDESALDGVSAVINLAGANVADGRWTKRRKELIRASRVDSTRVLVDAIARRAVGQRPSLLINASAAGWYGDTTDRTADESSLSGHGFLAQVCAAWEGAALRAEELDVRTVRLRLGVVLSKQGGALAKMLPAFKLGLGGRLGSGTQRMSWITMTDVIAIIERVLSDETITGAINAVSPAPATNTEFARTLGDVLHRPAFLPVPAWVLRLVFGQMADEALLADSGVVPAKLLATGFTFAHSELRSALQVALDEGA